MLQVCLSMLQGSFKWVKFGKVLSGFVRFSGRLGQVGRGLEALGDLGRLWEGSGIMSKARKGLIN